MNKIITLQNPIIVQYYQLTFGVQYSIIQVQGVRKTKVACECANAEERWHGEESNPICPILGADKRQWFAQPSEAKIIFQNPLTTE